MPRLNPRYRALLLSMCLALGGAVSAQTDRDTVRWDDRAGQWVYTLFSPTDPSRSKEVRYTPRILIEARVKSQVRWARDRFEYHYRISNGAGARQPISEIVVHAPRWDAQPLKHPPIPSDVPWAQILAAVRAKIAAEEAFVAGTLYSPGRWRAFLNLRDPGQVVFGWLADYQKNNTGIAPHRAQGSFSVLRTELPGAGWMQLQGYTQDMNESVLLPRAGALAEQVQQLQLNDSVDVTVLVPAIVVPSPYQGAELARRLKAHVATWPDAGLIDADTLQAVNSRLDLLIQALQTHDRKAAQAAAESLLMQARRHHADLRDFHIDDDDEAHDSKADKRTFLSARGTLEERVEPPAPLHRVAGRALAFNLKYLLARMEMAP